MKEPLKRYQVLIEVPVPAPGVGWTEAGRMTVETTGPAWRALRAALDSGQVPVAGNYRVEVREQGP